MNKSIASQGYARLALTPNELTTLLDNKIQLAEIKATELKFVYVEIDDLDRVANLLKWKKQ